MHADIRRRSYAAAFGRSELLIKVDGKVGYERVCACWREGEVMNGIRYYPHRGWAERRLGENNMTRYPHPLWVKSQKWLFSKSVDPRMNGNEEKPKKRRPRDLACV